VTALAESSMNQIWSCVFWSSNDFQGRNSRLLWVWWGNAMWLNQVSLFFVFYLSFCITFRY